MKRFFRRLKEFIISLVGFFFLFSFSFSIVWCLSFFFFDFLLVPLASAVEFPVTFTSVRFRFLFCSVASLFSIFNFFVDV